MLLYGLIHCDTDPQTTVDACGLRMRQGNCLLADDSAIGSNSPDDNIIIAHYSDDN